jgi:hypothetical protein
MLMVACALTLLLGPYTYPVRSDGNELNTARFDCARRKRP